MGQFMGKAKKSTPKLKIKKKPPYGFILDELADLAVYTKPMFGCLGVYYEDKIVLILRKKDDHQVDNGVWLATTGEHHKSLKKDFPEMRSIEMFGPGPTGWQNLPEDSETFESAGLEGLPIDSQKRSADRKDSQKKKALV